MRNLQQVQVRTSSGFEKICPFPVGYIYMSTNSTSPASTYGGTWSPLTDSRFLRPSGSWNAQGGESTHTLTVDEMPSHRHSMYQFFKTYPNVAGSGYATAPLDPSTQYTSYTGGGQAHNNLPPYRTCYCWYRTA